MSTKRFSVTPDAWVEVATGAAVVDLNNNCKAVRVTTNSGASPAIDYDGYHTLKYGVKNPFAYGGIHKVYVRADSEETYVIVTSDNIA